jgi:predicted RNase H-like HicB family nuclease
MIEAALILKIEIDQEKDGRWIAEIPELPGITSYGLSSDEAKTKVPALALQVVADRLVHGKAGPEPLQIRFQAACVSGKAVEQKESYPHCLVLDGK